MSSHVFHEIYLHINWHTKNDVPLLTPGIETHVHKLLQDRCRKNRGVYLHGVNVNQQERFKRLEWQRGFGVVSFGKQQLPWVLEYIAKQKEHHAKGTAKRRLELTGQDEGD